MPGPTDQEQLFLELINETRIDPMRNAARYLTSYTPLTSNNSEIQNAMDFFKVVGSDLLSAYQALTPVAPVAWNGNLATAAEKHTMAMIAADEQSHRVAGELGLGDRIRAEGYTFTSAGENVFTYTEDVMHGHAGFMVDWGNGPSGMQSPAGHRNNIMSSTFSEIGIDVTAETNPNTDVGPLVVTQDLADRGLSFVLGVAYSDNDHDQFYSIGEGRGDLQVQWGSASATSAASGGYSLNVGAGLQTITLSGGGLAGTVTVKTTIGDDNIKLDVVDGTTLLTSGSVEVSGAVSVIRGIGTLYGGLTITAGAGNNRVVGTVGNDVLGGGTGNDVLEGGNGNDTLDGGDGNDELRGGAGADILKGGSGNDVAIYAGARGQYTVGTLSDGRTSVTGGDSGGDTLEGIELLRFSDGDVAVESKQGGGGNSAPTVSISQSISLNEDGSRQFVVTASDGDGDPLTYTVGSVAHGVVAGGTGGAFIYTGKANYNGTDSFTVTISDGKSGTAVHTVNVDVIAQNDAPIVVTTQSVSTTAGTAKTVTVTASDIDGDSLTYAAGSAVHGSVTGGGAGNFVYTPTAGYSGNDSFMVTINDGKGGTATQAVNIAISAAPVQPSPSGNEFRLFAPDGFVGEIGGGGLVFGTTGYQKIVALDQPGEVRFDASFNRGGDLIVLPGSAGSYTILVSGSSAVLEHGDRSYSIPVGTAGTRILFDDGVRTLILAGGNVKLGNQTVGTQEVAVTAPSDNSALPSGGDPAASARLFLAGGAHVSVGGNQRVFGTTGTEEITYLHGDVVLDPSFNRGGDRLLLPGELSDYSAYVSGSTAVIKSTDGTVTIPVGTAGMVIEFGDGAERVVRFESATQTIRIGDVSISGSSASSPVALSSSVGGSGGTDISLDVGTGGTVAPIHLQDGVSYVLRENADQDSNVAISGFDADDRIQVTGAAAADYNYSSNGSDLEISLSDGSSFNLITIEDVVSLTDIIFDYATARAAVGHNFMTFA